MKYDFKRITAAASSMLLAMSTIPMCSANAVYKDSSEIAFALRAIETENCGYIADGNTVFVAPSAAQAGTSVRFGMYIEAEYADLAILYAKLRSDSDTITFNEESFYNPDTDYSDEAITYTMKDGTQFSTKRKPYCLGMINSAGIYRDNCFSMTTKFTPEENSMNLMWMHGMEASQTSATFFGSSSDEYSFIELELDIAPDTQPGEYQISFVADGGFDEGTTYLTSDDSEGGVSDYNDIVPTLKDLKIVIPHGDYFVKAHPTAFRWLDDPTPLRSEDFYLEGTIIYKDTTEGYAAEKLDFEKFSTGVNGMTIQYLTDPDEFICGNFFETYYDGMSISTPEYYSDGFLFSTVRSGLRGDANHDNMVNAVDAAAILVYAAGRGAGETPVLYSAEDAQLERTAYFLADVNEGSTCCGNGDGTSLDAMDASAVLTYAAAAGTGVTPDWNEILK